MTVDLSDEEIFAAADAVLASGQSATPARVRAHLGRGSPQRIGALLDQWWSQLLTRLRPDTIPATLAQALGMLWEQATALGRQDAERALARERAAWVEDRRLMEKAFAKQRQALEQLLTKERQAFVAQRQRALRSQEQLRERLRQSRETAKEAIRAVRVAQKNLDKAQRQSAFAQVVEAHHRQRDHVHALELNAAYRELSSRPLSVAEPSAIAASSPEGDGANLWRDFMPLLEAAQRTFEPRFAELRRLLNAEFPGQDSALNKTERDRCIGQLLVDQHLLDELRHQATAYSRTVDELCFEFMPLFLEMREKLLG